MAARMLQVRCTTWEQVEAFHTRKLRKGKLLSMKVPFTAELGAKVTLGLELPNQVVIAIDGTVLKASPIEGDSKTWIEVELHGFTPEVIARVRGMEPEPTPAVPVAHTTARKSQPIAAPIRDDELPADERQLFQHLTGELRRLRTCAVHDVLGVPRDADPEQVRRGWMNLVRRHHPDLVARRNAAAITHLAEELTILANRAYDRLRFALVAEGRATTAGPALSPPPGWMIGFDDISSSGRARSQPIAVVDSPAARPRDPTAPPMSQVQGGEAFEQRARAMLSDGDADTAQEVLAAALCVYPRSRPLRSLYYVASAISALYKGEVMLATSQLETALAHHDECVEAAQILEILRRPNSVPGVDDEMKRLFR